MLPGCQFWTSSTTHYANNGLSLDAAPLATLTQMPLHKPCIWPDLLQRSQAVLSDRYAILYTYLISASSVTISNTRRKKFPAFLQVTQRVCGVKGRITAPGDVQPQGQ